MRNQYFLINSDKMTRLGNIKYFRGKAVLFTKLHHGSSFFFKAYELPEMAHMPLMFPLFLVRKSSGLTNLRLISPKTQQELLKVRHIKFWKRMIFSPERESHNIWHCENI